MKMLFSLVVFVLLIVSSWRMYEKAGQSGWIGLIPVLNLLGLLKMIGKPYWWALLYLVPVLNVVVHLVVTSLVARSFGKSFLFGLGLAIPVTAPIFVMLLGLGEARYLGPRD
jgi:hypothetical protein